MYPYIRMFSNILKAKRQPKLSNPFEETTVELKVMPWDIDMFMEMNNGRYLTIMDTGRMIMGQRIGLPQVLKENDWGLMVAGVSTRFRYRLKPFAKFTLHTKLLFVEDRWFYFHQWFSSKDGKINASCLVRTAITSKQGIVNYKEVIDKMDFPEELMEKYNHKPEWVTKWEQSDLLHKEIMEEMQNALA